MRGKARPPGTGLLTSGFALLALTATAVAQQAPPPAVFWFPDTVLYNGKIVPLASDDPTQLETVPAMAIRDGLVLATGSNEEMLRLAGPTTGLIDLRARVVIPGIIDAQGHLMDYAIQHWASDLAGFRLRGSVPEDQWDAIRSWVFAAISGLSPPPGPGEWIEARLPETLLDRDGQRVSAAQAILAGLFTLEELDQLAPTTPLVVNAALRGVVNSQVRQLWEAQQPEPLPADGIVNSSQQRQIWELMIPVDQLAVAYRKEQDEWAAYGTTTRSSSAGARAVQAHRRLDQRGQMAIRFAYAPREPILGGPERGPIMVRAYLSAWPGQGSDSLWYHGISGAPVDVSSLPLEPAATPTDPEMAVPPTVVWGSAALPVMEAIVRSGQRLVNTSIAEDSALDAVLDMIEGESAAAGLGIDQIRGQRHAISLLPMSPRPDQLQRLRRLGVIASVGPRYMEEVPESIARDPSQDSRRSLPMRSLIDAGVRTAYELDTHDIAQKGLFYYLELMVTGVLPSGVVVNPDERLDRVTALYTATRWAAEYVMREAVLGSLETGKWADLLILNRDYFAVPEEQISAVRPVLTMVGGKIVYEDPHLRGRTVGYQIPREWE